MTEPLRSNQSADSPPPELRCSTCGSEATTSTRHPSKPNTVIVDCGTCGHTNVVAINAPGSGALQ